MVWKVLDTHCGAMQCNFSIFGKGSSFTYTWAATLQMNGFPVQTYRRHPECHIFNLKVSIKNPALTSSSFDPFCMPI